MSAGDKSSLPVPGEEFAEHRPALLRHCYRMMGSFEEAEDVVQDVLLRAWRSRETYAGDAPLAHWLMRIATNACLNALTRGRARALPQLDRAAGALGTPMEELEAATWVTPAPDARLFPDPARAAEAREQVALAFIALLQRLPPKQRAALLLKDVVGWSAEEIAAALDLTVSSVNSALHRARADRRGAAARASRRSAPRGAGGLPPFMGDARSRFAGGAAPAGRRVRHAARTPPGSGAPTSCAPFCRRGSYTGFWSSGLRTTPHPSQRPARAGLVLRAGGRRHLPPALAPCHAVRGRRRRRSDDLHRRALPARVRVAGGAGRLTSPPPEWVGDASDYVDTSE